MTRRAILAAVLLLVPVVIVSATPAAAATTAFSWGSDLSQWWSYGDAERNAAIGVSSASGMGIIVTDAKDGGPVGWASPSYPTITRFAAGDGGVERVTRDAHAKGLKVAARFDVFEDSGAAARFPYASLGGSPVWVDPACPEVRAYALDQLKELVRLVPVDEINLDHVRYPDGSESTKTSLPCTAPGADRSAIIASWVKEASEAARAIRPGVVVSISVFAYTMKGPIPAVGQDAALLAPHVDILRPMVYPAYISSAALADPYTATKDHTSAGVQRFGAAKVQPWVQGFDAYSTRPDLVCAQIRGAVDAGATGALVWWFASTGTSSTFWSKVAPCVPAGATAPSPSTIAFSPANGNEWWAQVTTTGATVVKMEAMDANTPWTNLPWRSWGAWAGSFHIEPGNTVTYRATLADGTTILSCAYHHPTTACEPETAPAPEPAYTASFALQRTRPTVRVDVQSSATTVSVTLSVDGGAPIALSDGSGTTWSKRVSLQSGAQLVFVATSSSGAKVVSQAFVAR